MSMYDVLFDTDEYGEVINSEKTFDAIAQTAQARGSVIIGWTDQLGSHFDVMFTVQPIQVGNLQGGLRAYSDLFVSIMRRGSFGFTIEATDPPTYAGYYAEKLNMGDDATTERLAEMINAVRERLSE